jgi:DNA end-binding protein Ku
LPEHEELQEEVRGRSFWSGTLTFGLVSIPVALFPAQRSVRVSLRMLSDDGTPLKREYYDPDTGRSLAADDIVRGYELEDGEYVVVTDDELESLEPKKSRDIDLRLFVDRARIDPAFFERAYFLVPAGDTSKAYRLLAETMERLDRAGIATFVMREREYLVAILAENGILRAETLRFADELRSPEDVGLPEPPNVKAADVKRFERELRKLHAKQFDPEQLHDRAAERLTELIARKQQQGEDVLISGSGTAAEPSEDVIDLMQILKRSLAGEEGRKAPRRSPAKAGDGRGGSPRKSASGKGGKTRAAGGDELAELSREELYERAKQLDIPGRSSMSKTQLVKAIRQA